MLDLFVKKVAHDFLDAFQVKRLLKLGFEILSELLFLCLLYVKCVDLFQHVQSHLIDLVHYPYGHFLKL
jgi:hypothetical protein